MEDETSSKLNEPDSVYGRITFSTVETQWDTQLQHALDLSPSERLRNMRLLNELTFGIKDKTLEEPKRIIWGSYEYIPS